jgi:hypothetical protein
MTHSPDHELKADKLIDAAAKDGRAVLVRRGAEYARARWTGDMWAYASPDLVHQLDFEPTHYGELGQ